MNEVDILWNFRAWEQQLLNLGFKVSTIHTGIFIHNAKGTIVADVKSVDGLRGFAQAVEYMRHENTST